MREEVLPDCNRAFRLEDRGKFLPTLGVWNSQLDEEESVEETSSQGSKENIVVKDNKSAKVVRDCFVANKSASIVVVRRLSLLAIS